MSWSRYSRPWGRATLTVVSTLLVPEADAIASTPHGRIGTDATSWSDSSPAFAASVSRNASPSGTSKGSKWTSSTPSSLTSTAPGRTTSRPRTSIVRRSSTFPLTPR